MNALKEVSKVWLVAKMVHTLFESILGNKLLEERLQKAAGKRHKKSHHGSGPVRPKEEPLKRKYDDMEMGFTNGLPAQQVSYERSRPQTPSVTPSRDLPQQLPMPQMTTTSPHLPRQNSDTFMGVAPSRSNTRPTTPFNPSYSYPGTPPDLFLVTRNSPNISQDLWQNFQPDQLFPADTNVSLPQISPAQHPLVDPQLQSQHQSQPQPQPQRSQQTMSSHMQNMQQQMQQVSGQHNQHPQQHLQPNGMPSMHSGMAPQHTNDPHGWAAHMETMNAQYPGNEETWSNSSHGQGPIVPTTLNVEDWYVQIPTRSECHSCEPVLLLLLLHPRRNSELMLRMFPTGSTSSASTATQMA